MTGLKGFGLLFFFLLLSCGRTKPPVNIETIDLLGAYNSRTEVLLSSIAEKIEYIPLESSGKCMFDKPAILVTKDSLVLVTSFRKVFVFNRYTGEYKYEISSWGRGPNEYTNNSRGYYEAENVFLAGDPIDNILAFSLDGSLKSKFKRPSHEFRKDYSYSITSFFPYSVNRFIGYSKNYSGVNPVKLEMFDSTGKVVFRYPNYNSFDRKKYLGSYLDPLQGYFFVFRDSIRFYEQYTDTIFMVTDKKLLPKYFIKMGEFAAPYEFQLEDAVSYDKGMTYFEIRRLNESTRYIFFNAGINKFRHLCYYDKQTKETRVCETFNDKEFYRYEQHWALRLIGLKNDIDDFVPVGTGRDAIYINREDELTTFIEAADMERWFRLNPEKATKLPDKLKRLSQIKPTDNIIVMVVTLKK